MKTIIKLLRVINNKSNKRFYSNSYKFNMKVIAVPLNDDNYGYILIDNVTNEAAIVDVSSQPDIMLSRVQEEGVKLTKIITTHKHWDHAGGNDSIAEKFPSIEIIGGEIDNCEGVTKNVNDNDEFNLGSLNVKCIHTPGHTMGSICFFIDDNGDKAVFTGIYIYIKHQ
jgi:hydroxyacylglutathione hydrolase